VAVDADAAFRRLGMPEGIYPLAHACLYLAACPKSSSVGRAFSAAREALKETGALPVPKKLRNAVTGLMKSEGYGAGYRYAHDYDGGHVPGEVYLPDALVGRRFYEPSNQGLEQRIGEKLARLRGEEPAHDPAPVEDRRTEDRDDRSATAGSDSSERDAARDPDVT
jgi:putative ATPase